MRVRDLQQYLGKFTNEMKGSNLSDAHVYIETQSGHLEEISRIEVQQSTLINASEPVRIVLQHENIKRWTTNTPKKVHI
jgi:hypothetical protein|tara:strand:+ start:483 stop:719 length:237 start_codon:yes stop_codon:yes gene_type:complete